MVAYGSFCTTPTFLTFGLFCNSLKYRCIAEVRGNVLLKSLFMLFFLRFYFYFRTFWLKTKTQAHTSPRLSCVWRILLLSSISTACLTGRSSGAEAHGADTWNPSLQELPKALEEVDSFQKQVHDDMLGFLHYRFSCKQVFTFIKKKLFHCRVHSCSF